ncbi:helix-turn-helix domain-containing protein [Stenotrophomonas maltophilia]|uniref:helix-turn-helix domain-containing protein n=1 Tax=Stenotrophomonas maltophilia TaxID=40324 RepID=UPI000D7D9FDF|nr:XRE family transcriptional regulator [Stenotrophomonas maltophilia]AWT14353.1 XRE family transcriptional regulator [Stenotrophomonas maltophilia]
MNGTFNPGRLIIARQRSQLSKKDLAAKTGVSQKQLKGFEEGERQPPSDVVDSLSKVLGFPAEFFFGKDVEAPLASNASFRSFSRMSAGQRDAALAAGGIAFEFSSWLDTNFNLPQVSVPDLAGLDPEAAAEVVRSEWSLGVRPIKNMVHLLESKGVRVFSLVEDTREVNAFSSWRNGRVPFVFLNTLKSPESSRFDAAHELGHLVLHRHGDPKGKEIEIEANAFASALLMPRSEMLALASNPIGISEVMRIKKIWNVSAMALVYRLHKVGVLTEWLYRSMCIELSSKGMRSRELDSADRETSLVLKKVFDAMKAEGRGLRDVARDLTLPVEELHKLIFALTAVSLGADNAKPVQSAPRRGHLTLVS